MTKQSGFEIAVASQRLLALGESALSDMSEIEAARRTLDSEAGVTAQPGFLVEQAAARVSASWSANVRRLQDSAGSHASSLIASAQDYIGVEERNIQLIQSVLAEGPEAGL